MLEARGACADQVEMFRQHWPNGAKPTIPALRKAARLELDLDWFASRFLGVPARAAYEEATAQAWTAYEEATAPAWAAYEEATAQARAAYEEATAQAWTAYREAKAQALAAYREAKAQALAATIKKYGLEGV